MRMRIQNDLMSHFGAYAGREKNGGEVCLYLLFFETDEMLEFLNLALPSCMILVTLDRHIVNVWFAIL